MMALNIEGCLKNALWAQADVCSNQAKPKLGSYDQDGLGPVEPSPEGLSPSPGLARANQARQANQSKDKRSWAEQGQAGLRFFFHGQPLLSLIFFSRPGLHFMHRHGTWGSVPGWAP